MGEEHTAPPAAGERRDCATCGRREVDHLRAATVAVVSSAEVTGPGGLSAKVTGNMAVLLVCCIAVVVGAMYFLKQHDDKMNESLNRIEAATVKNTKAQEGVIYVLTQSQSGREALNLGKPEFIREMEGKRP